MESLLQGNVSKAIVVAVEQEEAFADCRRALHGHPKAPVWRNMDPAEFYPLADYLDLVDFLEDTLSDRNRFLELGRVLGRAVIQDYFSGMDLDSVNAAIGAVQAAHEACCRPAQGGFEVLRETKRSVDVRYTAPYNCLLQEGLFLEIAAAYGGRVPFVQQKACRRDGDDACIYEIRYVQTRYLDEADGQ